VQYILLTPTYCNVINVYAFCNTHDITWGTKGDDKPPVLASAKTDKNGKLDVEVSIAPDDLNALYTEGLKLFEHKAPEEVKEPSKNDVQQDYYKGFRSAVVLAWMFCNAILIAVVLKSGGLSRLSVRKDADAERRKTQVIEIYLKVVLWSVVCCLFHPLATSLSSLTLSHANYFFTGWSFSIQIRRRNVLSRKSHCAERLEASKLVMKSPWHDKLCCYVFSLLTRTSRFN
jgi:hypothetical protein